MFHTLVSISDVIPNPFDPQGGLSAPQRVLAEEVALPEGFAAGLWAPAVGKTVPLLAQAFSFFSPFFSCCRDNPLLENRPCLPAGSPKERGWHRPLPPLSATSVGQMSPCWLGSSQLSLTGGFWDLLLA